jgi:hypothetical protein
VLPKVMFDYKGERTIDEQSPDQIAMQLGSPVAMAREPGELVRVLRTVAKAPARLTERLTEQRAMAAA